MRGLQAIAFVCALLFIFPANAQNFPVKAKELNKPKTSADRPVKIDAPFDRLVGKAWALVITGPDLDPLYTEQIELLTPAAEKIIEREIVTIHFHGRTLQAYPELSVAQYKLPSLNGSKKGTSTHVKIERMEEQLMTDDDIFSVVLVNKEGSVVYVWPKPVGPATVFLMMDDPQPMVLPVPKTAGD